MPAGPIEEVKFHYILRQRWLAIEPELFTKEGAKKYIGTWVELSGKPVSLKTPIVLKLAGGGTAMLTEVQKADRIELATFRKPPSLVYGEGPIVAVDVKNHIVTIKAVSTSFGQ